MKEQDESIWSRISDEAWEHVSTFEAYILGEKVKITTKREVIGPSEFPYVTWSSHSIISDTQAMPYQSNHAQRTAEQSLMDWISGIERFITQPNARMVKH
jgi:hypothetical protein